MPFKRRFLALVASVGLATGGHAAIIESYKIETARFFVQSTIGLGIDTAISTEFSLPGNFWKSRVVVSQLIGTGLHQSDWLMFSSQSQHLVPLDVGDPPKGQEFVYTHHFQGRPGLNGTEMQTYFGIKKHGPQSGDGIFGLTIASVNVNEIEFYSNFQLGVHMGINDTILTLIGELLSEGKNLLTGGTGVMIRRNGDKIYVGASKKGTTSSSVQSTTIRQGTAANPGPIIANFGGPEAWTDAPGLGIVLTKETTFDKNYMPDLESGNAFFEVVTGPFPLERFTSQLRQPNEASTYSLNTIMVESGLPFGGDLASLAASDDTYLSILMDENTPIGQVWGSANVVASGTEQLSVLLETSATRDDLLEFVELKQTTANQWDLVGFRITAIVDTPIAISVSNRDFLYTTPAAGTFQMRVRWIPAQDMLISDGWLAQIDQIAIEAR